MIGLQLFKYRVKSRVGFWYRLLAISNWSWRLSPRVSTDSARAREDSRSRRCRLRVIPQEGHRSEYLLQHTCWRCLLGFGLGFPLFLLLPPLYHQPRRPPPLPPVRPVGFSPVASTPIEAPEPVFGLFCRCSALGEFGS